MQMDRDVIQSAISFILTDFMRLYLNDAIYSNIKGFWNRNHLFKVLIWAKMFLRDVSLL